MTSTLRLRLRSPAGLLLDRAVERVVAEDLDGWFGIGPGRAELVAALPHGLLVWRDSTGEGFVAHHGGLLYQKVDECRVVCRAAVATRRLEDVADEVARLVEARRDRSSRHHGIVRDLVREALRRMAQELRG